MPSELPPVTEITDAAREARHYYDRPETVALYSRLWGGEDIHIGMYATPDEPVATASRRTLTRAGHFLLPTLREGATVLDLGAGTGGTARWLAGQAPCQVVALNISARQNAEHVARNRLAGLGGRIAVVAGNFESLPFPAGRFDAVCSFDSFLHSGDRSRVLGEVARVLRPGGDLVFTDIMCRENCPPDLLKPVLERIALADMASVDGYRGMGSAAGLALLHHESHHEDLVVHYRGILVSLDAAWPDLARHLDAEFLDGARSGLQHWIAAGEAGHLDWGLFHFRRP